MEDVLGTLIFALIFAVIGSLIGAIMLRAAAWWVEKMDVSFGDACVTVILAGITISILGFVVGLAVGAGMRSYGTVSTASLLMYPMGFLILSGFVSARIQIPFGRACLVSLIMLGAFLAIYLIVTVPFMYFA